MQKISYKNFSGEEELCGFKQEVKWICTDWHSPMEDREYIVSDGDGKTYNLYYAYGYGVKKLFDEIMERRFGGGTTFSDAEDHELTNDELIWLYQQAGVWYDVLDGWTDCGDESSVVIYREGYYPKYYLETNLEGPIDSVFEEYETIANELTNGKFKY